MYLRRFRFKTLKGTQHYMKSVSLSTHESSKLDLRIGRSTILKSFDINEIVNEIFNLSLDVCRIKLDLSNLSVFSELDNLGFPYSHYTFLINQTINLKSFQPIPTPPNLEMKTYKLSEKENLADLVTTIVKDDKMNSHYESDILSYFLPPDQIKKTIIDHQTTFDNSKTSDKFAYLAYLDSNLIGFCTMQINGEEGIGNFVGIAPEYRSNDLFKYFIDREMLTSKLQNCTRFSCSTISFNSRSLNTTLRRGMKIDKVLLNINIFSLLNTDNCTKLNIDSTIEKLPEAIVQLIHKKVQRDVILKEYKLSLRNKTASCISWRIKWFAEINLLLFFDSNKENYGYMRLVLNAA
jgi:hypothetical protein